ncbi:PilW family protein [Chromatiaceae bacterium AAb-1]|nr:PilW family protein [Chromatiaceae bacterium AAb-1]
MNISRGFSVAEVLIVLLLSAGLLAMTTGVLNNLLRSSRQIQQLNQLQQNAQLVLSLFHNELQHAGFWGGVSLNDIRDSASSVVAPAVDCLLPQIDSGSFPAPDSGFIPLYAATAAGGRQLNCISDAIAGSEFLQIKRLGGQILLSDELRTNRFYFYSEWPQGQFVSAATGNSGWYFPYQHQVFYLQRQQGPDGSVPVLMRKRLIRNQSGQATMTTDSVLDGVERLHFEFAIDSDLDGQADYVLATDKMQLQHWQQQQARILGIRFHILLRSTSPDHNYVNTLHYQMGEQLFDAPADHYRRLLLTSSITFQNSLF